MAILGDTPFLERITFFNGQRLLASDLQGLESFDRGMRELHNISLHQPGVGSGFAVSGRKGNREVVVSPGYALDALGREMILTMPNTEQVPAVADNGAGQPALYDLVVAYPSDDDLTPSETRDGVCMDRGVVRLHEEPVFCWVRLSDDGLNPIDPRLKELVRQQLMLVLARVQIQNCQLKQDVSVAVRRNARAARLPKVASGVTTLTPKDLKRRVINETASEGGSAVNYPPYSARVDTRSGKFAAVPCYQARLRAKDSRVLSSLMFNTALHVSGETATSFELELVTAPQLSGAVARSFPLEREQTLDVVWLGVEV